VAPGLLARGVLKHEGAAGAQQLAQLLALAGYGALALGHHDLSLERQRLETFLAALRARGIPAVATNLRCPQAPLCRSLATEAVVERGGRRVGILATLSPLLLVGLPRENRAGLVLDPPLDSVRAGVARLRARGVERIVLLTQGPRSLVGLEELLALQRELGRGPAPDVVLAGGLGEVQGSPLRLLRRDGSPPIVGSGAGVSSVAAVALGPRQAGERAGEVEVAVEVLPVAAEPGDPRAAALLAPQVRTYCERYGSPIGPATVKAPLGRDEWVGYVLSIMRRRAHAEIALVNRPFIKTRAFPMTGRLRLHDLLRAMPYHAPLGRARMTGADLLAKIAPALSNPNLGALGLERGAGGQVLVNGRPVDRGRYYRIASIPFVAEGGDDILPPGTLTLVPVRGAPDVRDLVQQFLERETAAHDGDPGVDPHTDFGPPASARPLLVGQSDLSLDLTDVAIHRQSGYTAPQLGRAEQRSVKGDLTALLQLRSRLHEADGRLKVLYGYATNRPQGSPAVSGETADLVSVSTLYDFRGLRDLEAPVPRAMIPDPYARLLLESELTRPAADVRPYRHAELTATLGAIFSVTSRLRLRGGPGLRQQLLAPGIAGRIRPLLEAGGTLDPVVLGAFGGLSARFEALADYVFVDPGDTREHQLKGTARLSFPLLPLLFLTTGIDMFAMQLSGRGWAAAYDTTIGLRLHLDAARQAL
jgi:2',3'-cyclic-nucleotide 2'-phosphodiesterase (5'-nucleotidase family)